MELVPGVHWVKPATPLRVSGNVYLLAAEPEAGGLTLVDTGMPGRAEAILRYVAALGHQPADVRRIVLTHYHVDHAGSLADLVARTGARVLVHVADAPFVEGRRISPAARGTWGHVVRAVAPFLGGRCVPVDERLAHGDVIPVAGGLRVVHTPGHTPGSIALHLPTRGVLFTGDTLLVDWYGRIQEARALFSLDVQQARDSARQLADLDFSVLAPGHGPPIAEASHIAAWRAREKAARSDCVPLLSR